MFTPGSEHEENFIENTLNVTEMWSGNTHGDHPVAHSQCAVPVCRSTLGYPGDVDSLQQNTGLQTSRLLDGDVKDVLLM